MANKGDLKKGCAFGIGMLVVMATGVVMFVFVYLPLRLAIGVAKLFGLDKRISRPRPRNRRD
jgi:hypothetical protein